MKKGKYNTEDNIINDNINTYVDTIRNNISIKPNIFCLVNLLILLLVLKDVVSNFHIQHHINNKTKSIKII